MAPRNPFTWPVTVRPEDIDGQGHASNVCVVNWMNHAAWEHSKALGWDVDRYKAIGGWFVVRRHEIDYHRPSFASDELHCITWPCALGKAVAERRHRIVRVSDQALIAEGFNIWAFIDAATGRPRRMPDEVRVAFDPAKFA